MSTILLIIICIVGGMLLFSVFDKKERQKIIKAIDDNERNRAERNVSEIVKQAMTESVNEDGMDAVVGMVRMTYAMNQLQIEVSHRGSELILNINDPNIAYLYYQIKEVLENRHNYTSSEISEAERFIPTLKEADIKSIQ